VREVTSMAANKDFLAVAEKLKEEKSAFFSIYTLKDRDFKRRKAHVNVCDQQQPVNEKYIVSLAFSDDSKFLACLLSAPDCKGFVYHTEPAAKGFYQYDFYKQEVSKITFHPKDNYKVCTSGVNQLQLWSVNDGTFKPKQEFQGLPSARRDCEDLNYSDHCWTPDDLIAACTDQGDIFAVNPENSTVIWTFKKDSAMPFSCLLAFSEGLVAGTQGGFLQFFSHEKGTS